MKGFDDYQFLVSSNSLCLLHAVSCKGIAISMDITNIGYYTYTWQWSAVAIFHLCTHQSRQEGLHKLAEYLAAGSSLPSPTHWSTHHPSDSHTALSACCGVPHLHHTNQKHGGRERASLAPSTRELGWGRRVRSLECRWSVLLPAGQWMQVCWGEILRHRRSTFGTPEAALCIFLPNMEEFLRRLEQW